MFSPPFPGGVGVNEDACTVSRRHLGARRLFKLQGILSSNIDPFPPSHPPPPPPNLTNACLNAMSATHTLTSARIGVKKKKVRLWPVFSMLMRLKQPFGLPNSPTPIHPKITAPSHPPSLPCPYVAAVDS